ncbi:MAG: lipid-A-disaccharide synthase [Rhodospirillales bacterium]|nr:lipid-A-disaccharide synthase [Rhodospirillales bacterium]
MTPSGPLIFVVAGEPSGDILGGGLMKALSEHDGATRFAGVGGPRMIDAGLSSSLFPMSELSIMGLAEVLPHLRRLKRRLDETEASVRALKPAAVVTIDSPGFTFRLARRLKDAGIPLIHFVAPSVWAWRPKRAKTAAELFDHLLALLPFEPPYFEREGLACTFVGHPVVESGADRGDGEAFRRRHGIAADAPVLCVLPGSRRSETSRLMPIFIDTLSRLRRTRPDLVAVIPAVSALMSDIRAAPWPPGVLVVAGDTEKFDAFAAANVALAASGTVALELAMAKTPAVIAYRVSALTHAVVRHLIKIRYANLVNIILDREAMPEFIQNNCRPELLAAAVDALLAKTDAAARQIEAGQKALVQLGLGGASPSRRAAQVVRSIVDRSRP